MSTSDAGHQQAWRSTGRSSRTSPPSERVKGNHATYLFFPIFTSLILILLSTLSASLLPGLAVVEIHSTNQTASNNHTQLWPAVVKLGGTGICIEGFDNFADTCVPYSLFGNNDQQLTALPPEILSLGINPSPSNNIYKIINLVAHILASSAGMMALIQVLGALDEYRARGRWALRYTRRAWHANSVCLLVNIVPFGLDVALITKAAAMVNRTNEIPIGKVVPGATIYMCAAALIINLATFLVWLFWARRQPAPRWLQSDFIVDPKLPSPESFIAAGSTSTVETGTQPTFDNGYYPGFRTGVVDNQSQASPILASEYPQHHQAEGRSQQTVGLTVTVHAPEQGLTANNHAV